METKEALKFIKMVLTYDQVGEVILSEQDAINYVEKIDYKSISDDAKSEHISSYFSEELENSNDFTAESLFLHIFGMTLFRLNELADMFDYQRVS